MTKPATSATIDTGHSLASGLVGLWLFNEGSGTANDYANNNDAAQASGTASWVTDGNGDPAISTASSHWHIDGGTNTIPAALQTNHQTIAALVYYPSLTFNAATFAFGDAGGLLFAHGNGSASNWLFYRRTSNWDSVGLNASTYMTASNWHWVVQTYDGANIKVYIDGTERASKATTGNLTYSAGGQPSAIGRYYADVSLRMSFLGIWNRALSSAEVSSLIASPYQMIASGGGATVNFAANVASTSTTPAAALTVARSLAANVASTSSTPDTAALTLARALAANVASASTTGDISLSASNAVALTASIASTSTTPAVALVVDRSLTTSAASTSSTPDTAALAVARSLAANAASTSSTPDAVNLSISGQVSFTASIASTSTTPDAALTVARSLASSTASLSSTPDTVTLETANQVTFAASVASTSTTPAPLVRIDMSLAAAAASQSTTGTPSLTLAHALQALVASTSSTPAINLSAAMIQGLVSAEWSARQPSITASARQPSITATAR